MFGRFCWIGWLLALPLLAGGCVMAGFAASVYGDPVVKAVYVPAKEPMLVLVRDTPDPTGMKMESDVVAHEIQTQIERHHIAPLVSPQKLDEIRRTNLSGFTTLTPQQLGMAVGAKQVLYVRIESSSMETGHTGDRLEGKISTTVAIIDVESGKQLWPGDGSSGLPVRFATSSLRASDTVTPLNVSRGMYAGLADKIVRLFRSYKPDME